MDALVKLNSLPGQLHLYLLVEIAIAMAFVILIKWLNGVLSKNSVTEELGVKDNFAFGISVASSILALTIVISSVAGRHVGHGLEQAAVGMTVFGVVGLILVKFGRFAQDKLVLDKMDTQEQVLNRNHSVAIADAANLVASSIILASTVEWVQGTDVNAIIGVVSGFLVVQTVLIIATRIHEWRYARDNQNSSFQEALTKGQLALAIKHAGHLIGTAVIVTSASHLLVYSPSGYVSNVTGWLVVSVALSIALSILVSISKRIVLFGMDYDKEIDQQENVGVACVELTISLGLAFLINGILGF